MKENGLYLKESKECDVMVSNFMNSKGLLRHALKLL